jgi:Fe2+ transport protein
VKEDVAMQTSQPRTPPMQSSDEADAHQLQLACEQGEALQHALEHMIEKVAHDGAETEAGEYRVGYAVENAEGMYHMRNGKLEWSEPEEENVHVEVSVRDGADGRFVPGLTVHATLLDADGNNLGTHRQPFLWHPWLYHYGRNRKVPGDGTYTLHIRIEPPEFCRHDKKNGKRFAEPVDVEFNNVKIKTGHK